MRKDGYYWVKRTPKSGWEMARWIVDLFFFVGQEHGTKEQQLIAIDSLEIKRFENSGSKTSAVENLLSSMEVNQQVDTKQFIYQVWGDFDNFIKRSFDVILIQAKKKHPEKEFKTVRGNIKRIS